MPNSFLTKKDLLTMAVEQDTAIKKSPITEGVIEGAKAALLAAPVGAAIQGIRGKNMYLGSLIAGLGAGTLAGLTSAAIQKYKNVSREADMRYHMRNMLDREPMAFMPPPQTMGEVVYMRPPFSQGFSNVYNE